MRQEKSASIMEALKPRLAARLDLLSKKSDLSKAIKYTFNHWDGLNRLLNDGRIEIDSNTVERAIRPLTLGRKNHLFAGSEGGTEHWAILASLIATCKINDGEPQAYLTDVLTKLVNGHLQSRLDDLLPLAYAPGPFAAAAAALTWRRSEGSTTSVVPPRSLARPKTGSPKPHLHAA